MSTILVIDDDADFVGALRVLLEARGHRVLSAANGDQGLERVRSERPDLIILDIMLDQYTEGFRISQRLRDPGENAPFAALKDVPILVLTAVHRTTHHRFQPNESSLPVNALLEKPVAPDLLLRQVDELLAQAGTAAR